MTGDWGRGEWGPVSVRKEEKVLGMDGAGVLTMPQNSTF